MLTNLTISNQLDLQLLEDMGIVQDVSVREKKHSLRTVGFTIIASIRMRKMAQAWAGNKKVHESLLKKLDGMKRAKQRALGR